jgi:1-acyl-sn-glycerol-3-phosphate acyltransferase
MDRPPIKLSTRLASYFLRNPAIYLSTAVLGTVSLTCSLFDRPGVIQHRTARLWSRFLLWASSSQLTVEGIENIDPTQAAIYAPNHSSALDIPALFVGLPFQFRILAKIELFRLPFLGWHLRRSGQIAIDRSDARASVRSLGQVAQSLKSGMNLVVFPEGGRSRDGHIQSFLGGTFYAAIKAQRPIVPVAIIGTYQALPMNTYAIKPGPFRLIIGKPIATVGMVSRDMEMLSARVRQAMCDLYYANCELTAPAMEQDAAK